MEGVSTLQSRQYVGVILSTATCILFLLCFPPTSIAFEGCFWLRKVGNVSRL